MIRQGIENEPRDMAIYLLRAIFGEPILVIGAKLGMTRYSSVSSAEDRIWKKLATNDEVLKRLDNMVALVQKGPVFVRRATPDRQMET